MSTDELIAHAGAGNAWAAATASELTRQLVERCEATRRAEVERTLRRLPHLSEADKQRVEELSCQLVSAILDPPLRRLESSNRHLPAARDLFGAGQ